MAIYGKCRDSICSFHPRTTDKEEHFDEEEEIVGRDLHLSPSTCRARILEIKTALYTGEILVLRIRA